MLNFQSKIRTRNVTDKNQPELNDCIPNPISLLFYEFEEIPRACFLAKKCGKVDFKTHNLDSKNYLKLYFNVFVMSSDSSGIF
jgi:hypothetical protein